ncbi:MAG: response regulator [Candidatus Paceibacterota bacterium]
MKNVFIIEDVESISQLMQTLLEKRGYAVVLATNVQDALDCFPRKVWDAIIFDGCLGGEEFNSGPLIEEFKDKVPEACLLVAASSSPDLRKTMMKMGCTHETPKNNAPNLVHSLLRELPE